MYLTALSTLLLLLASAEGRCPTPETLPRTTDYVGLQQDPYQMAYYSWRKGPDMEGLKNANSRDVQNLYYKYLYDPRYYECFKRYRDGKTTLQDCDNNYSGAYKEQTWKNPDTILKGPERFLCARAYEENHPRPYKSCTGRSLDIPNDEYVETIGFQQGRSWRFGFWHDKIMALVVRPRCVLHAYQHRNMEGLHFKFPTGQYHYLRSPHLMTIDSWHCECQYTNEIFNCNPREEWVHRATCDPGAYEGECSVNRMEGTEWGSEVTQGRSVENTVSFELAAALSKIFTASLSGSTTKGRHWETTKINMKSHELGTGFECNHGPGEKVEIQEKLAVCGGTKVHLNEYRCRKV